MQGARLYNELGQSTGPVLVCTHRYMFQIEALSEAVRGADVLKPSVEIHGGLAYLVHHLGDITAIPGVQFLHYHGHYMHMCLCSSCSVGYEAVALHLRAICGGCTTL
jgi:hypothetical protein